VWTGNGGGDGRDAADSATVADALAATATIPVGPAQIAIALAVFCQTDVHGFKVN